MIKNIKISLGLIGAFIVIIIASSVLISAQSQTPKGVGVIEKLISACEARSVNKITAVIDPNSMGKNAFSSCVTVDDYLNKCGIYFNISNNDTIKDVYLLGSLEYSLNDEESALAALEEIFYSYSKDMPYRYIAAYIGIDYVDENGDERSKVTSCIFVINDKNGKIYSIR